MATINNKNLETNGVWPFPKDDLSPAIKEKKGFGYDIARAIWGFASTHETHLFYNDRTNYRRYRQYALGRQSQEDYKPLLHEAKNSQNLTWLKAIDFKIKNYATKRINIVVSKMMAKDYDVVVDMVDPLSRGILENIKRGMEIKMKNKAKLQEVDEILGKKDFDNIPDSAEELNIIMDTDFKMVEAVHLEKAIPWHMDKNRYEDIRKLTAFDLVTLGVGAQYSGMDENLRPVVKRFNPADIIAPFNETPNYEQLPYIAGIEWVTVPEFRKLALGYLSDERIKEIVEEFSKKQYDSTNFSHSNIRQFDDIAKIALLHYNYKSTDTMVFLQKSDKLGNVTMFEKEIDYYARPKEMDRFREKFGTTRQIHRESINAVYEGYWVIGSDKQDIFRHGRRAYSKESTGAFNSTGMGFKVYAPNSWDGYVTSMTAQMLPVLDELQRYNLKIQQVVARAIPKGIGIDLFALRKAKLTWGGKELNDQAKIEMFMKSGIFTFSSKGRYAPGSNYRPFYEVENGLADDIEKYLRLIQNALLDLDEIIGINKVVAASNIREDAGKAVTELQVGASEVALDYLYKADKKIFNQVVQDVGRLHIQSYRYSPRNQVLYDAMFGQSGMAQAVIRFDLFEYGFNIEVRPTDAEWADIYNKAEKAYDKDIIAFSDTLYLREFNSIKQARLWLINKEKQAIERAEKAKQADIAANAQVQRDSIEVKAQAEQALEEKRLENGKILEEAKRQTLTHAALVEINKEQKILALQAGVDLRENAQEGKIESRHIEEKGEIQTNIAAMNHIDKGKKAKETKK